MSGFELYHSQWCTLPMARYDADSALLIAAEPGVWLRPVKSGGHEVYSRWTWRRLAEGEYVVNYGHDPAFTAVVSAAYVLEHYSREPAGTT